MLDAFSALDDFQKLICCSCRREEVRENKCPLASYFATLGRGRECLCPLFPRSCESMWVHCPGHVGSGQRIKCNDHPCLSFYTPTCCGTAWGPVSIRRCRREGTCSLSLPLSYNFVAKYMLLISHRLSKFLTAHRKCGIDRRMQSQNVAMTRRPNESSAQQRKNKSPPKKRMKCIGVSVIAASTVFSKTTLRLFYCVWRVVPRAKTFDCWSAHSWGCAFTQGSLLLEKWSSRK